ASIRRGKPMSMAARLRRTSCRFADMDQQRGERAFLRLVPSVEPRWSTAKSRLRLHEPKTERNEQEIHHAHEEIRGCGDGPWGNRQLGRPELRRRRPQPWRRCHGDNADDARQWTEVANRPAAQRRNELDPRHAGPLAPAYPWWQLRSRRVLRAGR